MNGVWFLKASQAREDVVMERRVEVMQKEKGKETEKKKRDKGFDMQARNQQVVSLTYST